ncbi:hypothetical protein J2X85_002499 [Microbacterium trichothecenolyticum]|uniref:hypothetical protein n=1 Tax=Microbacterium trichothecenolyticum TaxID=69370 RepID=UPI002859CEC3|nr:hypothetical protein [Microbacterium trichothecenolyticum]MDR7185465.1 hypothetical protein [Microbacterium trichothecenolyticum]
MKLPVYLSLLVESERTLARGYRQVAQAHGDEPDVHFLCLTLAGQCETHVRMLQPSLDRYGTGDAGDEPERLHADGLDEAREGPLGLLRDLQDLYLLASLVDVTWNMIKQVAQALPDRALLKVVTDCDKQTGVQLRWLLGRMKQAAPQVLIAVK